MCLLIIKVLTQKAKGSRTIAAYCSGKSPDRIGAYGARCINFATADVHVNEYIYLFTILNIYFYYYL